jgi:transposase
MKLVRETLDSIPVERPQPTPKALQNLCLDTGDTGYDYDEVRETVRDFGFTAHIRARGEEAHKIKRRVGFKARRWVVEGTHSWMNRFRGILIRWEKQADNYLGLLHFVCGIIAFQQAGLFG